MILKFKILSQASSVNSFYEVDTHKIVNGNATSIFFRLIQDRSEINQDALRYIPESGAQVSVTFNHIDASKVITRVATQPYTQDTSIWKVDILATDQLSFNTMAVTITEGSNIRTIMPSTTISVIPTGSGQFFC